MSLHENCLIWKICKFLALIMARASETYLYLLIGYLFIASEKSMNDVTDWRCHQWRYA